TCASMFFYHDKLNEIDLEFLGSYANANASANSFYGTQTGDPNQIDNPAAWKRVPYVADQTSAFKEYRFDWGPGAIDYYMNGAKQHTATAGVPAVGGSLILNHWSGGSSGWELGPPSTATTLQIQSFVAYFNLTQPTAYCSAASNKTVCTF
ncbi:hypothetical protein HDU91_000533, partial [Kappamyces sp. JEL0680]